MDTELFELESEMIDMAWNNYYKLEILRGYCENCEDDIVSSIMLEELLNELAVRQKQLIHQIDKFSTYSKINCL